MSLQRNQRRGKQRVNADETYQRLFSLRLFMNAQATWLYNPEVSARVMGTQGNSELLNKAQ